MSFYRSAFERSAVRRWPFGVPPFSVHRSPVTVHRAHVRSRHQAPSSVRMEDVKDDVQRAGEGCRPEQHASRQGENPGEQNISQCFCL